MNHPSLSRRAFLRFGQGALTVAGLQKLGQISAYAQATDYKALVCIFLLGGNDGHNMLVPQQTQAYNAYKTIRGSVALPDVSAKLLPVTTTSGVPYALSDGLAAIHPLWAQKKLAAVANVGMLVQPTTRTQYLASSVPLPTNLFSHSDQIQQMQSGTPSGSGGTGWAGRVADAMQASNGVATFPASISMAGPQLFCTGNVVPSASLLPGSGMDLYGMSFWPDTAAAARQQGLQEILALDSGLAVVQAANQVRKDALSLAAMLKSTGGGALTTAFPGTGLGNQLKDVARLIQLRNTTGMKRQVFFCSLNGFDTHGSQSWTHWDLLLQLGAAMKAFYDATVEMGIADKVTTFLESDFGRTLQPSGQGTDHAWGNHFLVMGGAVAGGDLYGTYPTLALGGPDDAGSRGVMIPTTSLDQYGATLARWFGVPDATLPSVFSNLNNFAVKNVGFMG